MWHGNGTNKTKVKTRDSNKPFSPTITQIILTWSKNTEYSWSNGSSTTHSCIATHNQHNQHQVAVSNSKWGVFSTIILRGEHIKIGMETARPIVEATIKPGRTS
jgi:hypothetical protein